MSSAIGVKRTGCIIRFIVAIVLTGLRTGAVCNTRVLFGDELLGDWLFRDWLFCHDLFRDRHFRDRLLGQKLF